MMDICDAPTSDTPLKKSRNGGSHSTLAQHWFSYRLASVALVPLNLWLVISLVSHAGDYHVVMLNWIKSPVNAVLLLLNTGFIFHHAVYGLEEVLIDYVPHPLKRLMAVGVMKGFFLVLAVACIYAILSIALRP